MRVGCSSASRCFFGLVVAIAGCGGSSDCAPSSAACDHGISSISITPATVQLPVGQSTSLTANVVGSSGTGTSVTWSSSNTAVAALATAGNQVTVTAVGVGAAQVTAAAVADPTRTAAATITVTEAASVKSVTVTPATGSLLVADSLLLTATVATTGSASTAVNWSSSSTAVAAVSSAGRVRGVGAGTATIIATAQADPTKSASATLTITPRPVTLKLVTTPSSIAQTMTPLAQQPVIQLFDDLGNAVTGNATITAAISTGNAIVGAGGSAQTNASGAATFTNLTLGALQGAVGAAQLRFSAPGATSVTANVSLSCFLATLTLGVTVNDRITGDGDCVFAKFGGASEWYREYRGTIAAAGAIQVNMSTTAFVAGPFTKGPNENFYWFAYRGTVGLAKILLPAGEFRIDATADQPGANGPFSLTVRAISADVINCENTLVMSPLTASGQQLTTTDCLDANGYFSDVYYVGLPAGGSVTTTETSTAFAPYVGVWVGTTSVAFNTGATAATATYRNATTSFQIVEIDASSNLVGRTGAYALSVTATYPNGNVVPADVARAMAGGSSAVVRSHGSHPPPTGRR